LYYNNNKNKSRGVVFRMKKSIFRGSNLFQTTGRLKKSGLFVVLLGFLFSCASSPPQERPAPPPPPPAESPAPPPAAPDRQKTTDFTEAKARAVSAMDKAKSVKADVSVKARYNSAFSAYTEAESLAAAGSTGGIEKYLEAETGFLAAHDEAIAKREEAQRQLLRAREAIKTAEDTAAEFEREQAEDRRKGSPQ
jgi:hypothetical protein